MASPTHAQRLAADPQHSVWVTANAGTGKTRVLTNRVLQLLLNGAEPRSLLCLTFTKAAAAEMRSRITKELRRWAVMDATTLEGELKQLLDTDRIKPEQLTRARTLFAQTVDHPQDLKIQTIHSFCQMILQRFPLEAGIHPQFTVMEDGNNTQLLQQSWRTLLTNIADADTHTQDALSALLKERAEGTLTDTINDLLHNMDKLQQCFDVHGDITAIKQAIYESLHINPDENEAGLIQQFCSLTAEQDAELRNAAIMMLEGGSRAKDAAKPILQFCDASISQRTKQWPEFLESLLKKDSCEPKSITGYILTKTLIEKQPDLVYDLEALQSWMSVFAETLKKHQTASLSEHLITLLDAVHTIYATHKHNNGAYSYSDIIDITYKLLSNNDILPWIMYRIDSQICHLMVDEAQDTNPKQWGIIDAICGEFFSGEGQHGEQRTLFVVGDEKQSLYSFQGADVSAFTAYKAHFSKLAQQSTQAWHEQPLTECFRCASLILKAVDTVFTDPELQHAASASTVSHLAARKSPASITLWPEIEKTQQEESSDHFEALTDYAIENSAERDYADFIAKHIKSIINSATILPSRNRAVEYADIMLLFSKRNHSFITLLIKAMQSHNIPVSGVDRLKLQNHMAIRDLITLARSLLLLEDELTLAELLKTPFIGLDDDALMALCINREQPLWQRVRKEHPDIARRIAEWQQLSRTLTPHDFFLTILDAHGGRKQLEHKLGSDIHDPINEFLQAALNYQTNHTPALQPFIQWFESSNAEVKRDMEHSGNEVRIMTVHGAKGLEAPIVILPDTHQVPPNKSKGSVWDKESSLLYFYSNKDRAPQLTKHLNEQQKQAEMEEYWRGLYVAMTRAEDQLYIGAMKPLKANSCASWYDKLTHMMREHANPLGNNLIWKDGEFDTGIRTKNEQSHTALPSYFSKNVPYHKPVLSTRPSGATPSPLIDPKDFARGNAIHALLQHLPNVPAQDRHEIARRLLQQSSWTDTKKYDETIENTLTLMNQHSELFNTQSAAEVPISYKQGEAIVSGQIDRLVIMEDEAWIVDYKTHQKPPADAANTPEIYRRQLQCYRDAIAPLYPSKTIRCFLLWTHTLNLVEIMLDSP